MRDKITFFMMNMTRAEVRQFSLSKPFIFFILFMTVLSLCAVGIGAYDYYRIRMTKFNNRELAREISAHQEIIASQRKQIQEFAGEINSLKSQLVALSEFERQIRMIANLDHPETRRGLFGIGGSAPEDLDPKTDLRKKHNALMREMHEQTGELAQAGAVQQKNFASLIKELNAQKNILKCTPAIRPAEGVFTSVFGERESPFTGMSEFHSGLDIAAPVGTPVIAPADGKVIFADTKGGFGKIMEISHGFGLVTRYAHLEDFVKNVGDTVKRGEKIAIMGNTGRSTGPHLHYEVHLNSVPLDPSGYILN